MGELLTAVLRLCGDSSKPQRETLSAFLALLVPCTEPVFLFFFRSSMIFPFPGSDGDRKLMKLFGDVG